MVFVIRALLYSSNQYSMIHQKMQGLKVNNYSFLKRLGAGSFAVVYQGINQRDGSTVAIKTLPRSQLKANEKIEELVGTQIRVMRAIAQKGNENVVRFIDRFMSLKSLFIVMEYCNGGNLEDEVRRKKFLSEQKATEYLKQILNGFRGMHEANAMHRDFKLANLLLHQGVCKIADLGFAKQLAKGSVTTTFCGTSQTMAPEVLAQKPYGMQVDIWSLGVVYYQMLFGKYPYFDQKVLSDAEMLKLIQKTKIDYSSRKVSETACDFIKRCLTIEPKERISWVQIYQHPLIKTENKMIYGLSNLRVTEMKNFYKGGLKMYEDDIHKNLYKKKQQNISLMDAEQAEPMQSTQMLKKIQLNEQKKQEEKTIKSYEDKYLSYRNNIMFIFKYVTPYTGSLQFLIANHDITLFITAKKAYQDMLGFSRIVEQRKNFLNLNPCFNRFTQSRNYKQISDRIKTDVQLLRSQVYAYCEGMQCSNEVKQEFDADVIKNKNWQDFVYELVRSYQFQLAGGMETVNGGVKRDVIAVIEALNYYRNNLAAVNVEYFEDIVNNLDYDLAQKQIQQRLLNSLKFND